MIILKNIHVGFAKGTATEKKALNGINLEIGAGEFVVVIGSNGAGKSTLLNTIAGEVIPSKGSIEIEGKDVTRLPTHQRSDLVARVFQDPLAGTCADLTIAENMALALSRGKSRGLRSCSSKCDLEMFKGEVTKMNLGVEGRMNTMMSMLSGGQRQAVSLLMATLSPLQILLLDEHTAALDPKTAAYVMELTRKIILEKNLTALMVTHSLRQALDYGTRTIMLHNGEIIYDVRGDERKHLTVDDLLKQFGVQVDDDKLMLQ